LLVVLFSALCSCSKIYVVENKTTSQYIFNDSLNSKTDSSTLTYIQPYKEQLAGIMSEVLIESAQALTKGNPEGILGDYCADACQRQSIIRSRELGLPSPDMSILNNGGLRVSLPKGNITMGNIFELMPFENSLVLLELSGTQLLELLNFIAEKNGTPVSGVKFIIKDKKATSILINNSDFNVEKKYWVATSDYLANGGDNLVFLKKVSRKENLNLKVRDAFVNDLRMISKENKLLKVELDGRISVHQ
jgi:2',3'-cyclic-nucleotide 2'-phosphodiesterase (5'-nucleotidase family)